MGKAVRHDRIPTAKDWAGAEADLAARHARTLLLGKSLDEALAVFGQGRSIERADELRHVPRRPFQYYVFAFATFVRSDAAQGDADSASCFLRLLLWREEADPGSVAQVWPRLAPMARAVWGRQAWYEADPAIYGSFVEMGRALEALLGEAPSCRA